MELYKGQLIIELFTVVESQYDEKQTRNLAHAHLTTEFFEELRILTEAKGYSVGIVGANLTHGDTATNFHIKAVQKATEDGQKNEKRIRKSSVVTRIEI